MDDIDRAVGVLEAEVKRLRAMLDTACDSNAELIDLAALRLRALEWLAERADTRRPELRHRRWLEPIGVPMTPDDIIQAALAAAKEAASEADE